MLIDREVEKYCVLDNQNVTFALEKLTKNKMRILFVVNKSGVVKASFTDGDFRRWILKQNTIDMSLPVMAAANTEFLKLDDHEDNMVIAESLSNRIEFVPLVDELGRISAVACAKETVISIGRFNFNELGPAFIIAEIGNNHNGSIKLAKNLVDAAQDAGADCVKFQMRDLEHLYANKGDADDVAEDLGSQYVLDLLSRFQLSDEEFIEIFDYCDTKGITAICTPFDGSSADKLDKLGVPAFKVASADLTNHDLLKRLAKFRKPLIVSTGMSTEDEIIAAAQLLKAENASFVLLHCNSTYPAPFKDVNLNYLKRLKEIGGGFVGYSGHERGFSVPVAAVALGAKVIEKHFTLDKSMEGNDHKVSLLPKEFKSMVDSIRAVEMAMGESTERVVSQGEMMNRETLGKSVVARVEIAKGQTIHESMLAVNSPGKGLKPYRKKWLVGRESPRNLKAGDFFYDSDLSGEKIEPKNYTFALPFGIPVRFHDFSEMVEKSNFDFVEFHLSYKDLDVVLEDFLYKKNNLDFVVHAPELFAGDHTLDLCSLDEEYRRRSISELQRVVDLTEQLRQYFPSTKRPSIVTNVGGFSSSGFLTDAEVELRMSVLRDSLAALSAHDIDIIPQTMPPFPWHFGGQQFHNLFLSADQIVGFCEATDSRVCLDISHSKLACNYFDWDFEVFVNEVAPYSSHIHIADARGSDQEGLQIGEGEVNFRMLFDQLKVHCPNATWLPEIWQGHKNSGEGFWLALNLLEGL